MNGSSKQKIITCLLIVMLDFLFLAYPGVFQFITSDVPQHFRYTTWVLITLNTALFFLWSEMDVEPLPSKQNVKWFFFCTVLCFGIAAHSLYSSITLISSSPIDPHEADMLPQIYAGLKVLFSGENPYRAYHDIASWEIRFVYGPGLWGPFIVPYLLGIDLRYMSLFCGMLVPVSLMLYAVYAARRGQYTLPVLFMLCAFVMLNNHAYRMFIPIAHSTTYWFTILLFCYVFYQQRTYLSTGLLACLLLSRTTMVAVVPVYCIYVFIHHRKSFHLHALLFIVFGVVPMLPFIIWDYQALIENMILNYTTVIKESVWNDPILLAHTVGLTSLFVQNDYGHWLGYAQAVLLLLFFVYVWFRVKNVDQYIMGMAFALFLFSLTTLWPVFYIFFDVFVWMISVILAKLLASEGKMASEVEIH